VFAGADRTGSGIGSVWWPIADGSTVWPP